MLRDLIMRYNSDGGGRVQQVERDLEAAPGMDMGDQVTSVENIKYFGTEQ